MMLETIYSPAKISLLLRIHTGQVWYLDNPDAPGTLADIDLFIEADLIKKSNEKSQYVTTQRGNILVEMLCNTPLPMYKDPRIIADQELDK